MRAGVSRGWSVGCHFGIRFHRHGNAAQWLVKFEMSCFVVWCEDVTIGCYLFLAIRSVGRMFSYHVYQMVGGW